MTVDSVKPEPLVENNLRITTAEYFTLGYCVLLVQGLHRNCVFQSPDAIMFERIINNLKGIQCKYSPDSQDFK